MVYLGVVINFFFVRIRLWAIPKRFTDKMKHYDWLEADGTFWSVVNFFLNVYSRFCDRLMENWKFRYNLANNRVNWSLISREVKLASQLNLRFKTIIVGFLLYNTKKVANNNGNWTWKSIEHLACCFPAKSPTQAQAIFP